MLGVDSRRVVYRVCKFSSFLCHYLFLHLLFAWLWFYISCLGCLVLYSLFLCRVELGVGGTLFLSLIRVDGVYILFFLSFSLSPTEFSFSLKYLTAMGGSPVFLPRRSPYVFLWVVLCLITRSHTKYISTPHPCLVCFLLTCLFSCWTSNFASLCFSDSELLLLGIN